MFDHAAIGGVIAQFDRVTGHNVTKGVIIENKVRELLSLKYFLKMNFF